MPRPCTPDRGKKMPVPAGEVLEAPVNSKKSGLGWQEEGDRSGGKSRGVAGEGGSGWVWG